MDRLEEVFELQRRLQTRLGRDVEPWTNLGWTDQAGEDEAKRRFWSVLRDDVEAMQQELAELTDCFPWKHWRPASAQSFDLQNARVEVVDMLHFLLNIAMKLGMDAQGLYGAFVAKNEVNHCRQDSGYLTKYDDCRHI